VPACRCCSWRRADQAVAFPLAFLLFMLPIPLAVTARPLALRQWRPGRTAHLLPWLGIPVYAEPTTLNLANGVLEIADACSGFSTLYAAMATAFLCAVRVPGLGPSACWCSSWRPDCHPRQHRRA